MKYVPHDYQRYVTNYIETHPACAVLLDMGLGKTSITLTALLDLLFDTFEAHRILVIAPLRVMDARSRSELTEAMRQLTELENPNSVQQMKQWLADNGMEYQHRGLLLIAH